MFYPPRANELLSSWIIRNSIVQGSDPMGWVYGFWGEWRAWTRDIDRFLPKLRTFELARFCKLSPERIREMTLAPLISRITEEVPDIYKSWTWVIPTGKRNRSVVSGLQFCPECLQERDTFLPRHWRLSWHTQCVRHRKQLLDKCSWCAMPFSPHLIDYAAPYIHLCPRCGNDLRQTNPYTSNETVLKLQQTLDALLVSPYTNPYPHWNIQGTKEFFLFLRDLLVLSTIIARKKERYIRWQSFLFGRPYFDKLSSKAGMTFDMRSVEERVALLFMASHLLEHDSDYLINSLRHIHFTQAILNERNFPKSTLLYHILTALPPSTVTRHTQTGQKKETGSKEPRTAAEIEVAMSSIRRFL